MNNDAADTLRRYIELTGAEQRQFVYCLTEYILAQPLRSEADFRSKTGAVAKPIRKSDGCAVCPPAPAPAAADFASDVMVLPLGRDLF